MLKRFIFLAMVILYLAVIAYFALRPLDPIIGLRYEKKTVICEHGAVRLQKGVALEDRSNVSRLRKALMHSGQLSLVAVVRADDSRVSQGWILADAYDPLRFNFVLAQDGNDISFQLKTTRPERHGSSAELIVPHTIRPGRWQLLVGTYDGLKMRVFVDGELRGEERLGIPREFLNGVCDAAFVVGDAPAGRHPWRGLIRRIAVYDRALAADEVARMHAGESISGAILDHDLRSVRDSGSPYGTGLVRLRYRNLFLFRNASVSRVDDIILNIIGFLPLGVFTYMAFSTRRKLLSALLFSFLAGLVISGGVEWMQRYLLLRVPSVLDLASNITGSLLGGLLAWAAVSIFRKLAGRVKIPDQF